jgi:ATP synthase protein I
MPVPEIRPPDPDGIESRIARDIARHALWVAPLCVIGAGIAWGTEGALGMLLAFVVVLANFLVTGAALGWAARISPGAIMGVALGGFLVWLFFIFGTGVLVEQTDAVNLTVYVVSVLVLHLGLLAWETRSISFSLASPGLKPRKS